MSQNQITTERPWQGIPTKQLVNTETGQTEIFLKTGPGASIPFIDIKVAQSGQNNKWEITNKSELLNRYNVANPNNKLTQQQLDKLFFTDGTKTFNNDRASVINANSPENTKTFLATKPNPVPGITDPKTGITATQTSPTAAPPASPGASPGASPSESKLDPALFNKAIKDGIKGQTIRTNYGSLRYPQDIDNTQSDLIEFTMKSYGTRGFDAEQLKLAPKRNFGEILGSATLSIQPRISDQNTVTWNDSKMDPISMGLANASLGIIENGFDGLVSGLDKLGNSIKSERSNIETAMKITLAQEAAKTQNLLSRLTGAVLNPNLELLFESPNLRTFNYSFQLSPRDKDEAKQVQSIIRFFKQGMAPQRTDSELFLKAPNVFDIQYLRTTVEGVPKDHPYINRVKGPCALVNCSVDYTPNGSYMTFAADGSMVTYNLSLIFSELEPVYEDDYYKIDRNGEIKEIGY